MHRLRNVILLLASSALAIAACGSNGAESEPPSANQSPAQTNVSPTQIRTRNIAHVYGETAVPADLQRVVVLDSRMMLGTALLLGVPVVGYQDQPFGPDVPSYLDDQALSGAEGVGFNTISLEKVASVRPDLIIGNDFQISEELYPQFEQIAPTVALEVSGVTPWKNALREVGKVFGGGERTEQAIADYEVRTEQLRDALGERQGSTVTLANLRALDDIRIISRNWCSGSVLEEVGLTRPANQRVQDIKLSIERLGELDADLLLYFVGSSGTDPMQAAQAEEAIKANPLWNTLGAVKAGKAFRVDTDYWFSCGSMQAQNLVLGDLERILLSPQ